MEQYQKTYCVISKREFGVDMYYYKCKKVLYAYNDTEGI